MCVCVHNVELIGCVNDRERKRQKEREREGKKVRGRKREREQQNKRTCSEESASTW